jgi:hypothetical protein
MSAQVAFTNSEGDAGRCGCWGEFGGLFISRANYAGARGGVQTHLWDLGWGVEMVGGKSWAGSARRVVLGG